MSVSYTANQTSTSQFAQKNLSFLGVFRSEILKFRTLTTNWVMTLVIAVVMIGLSLAGAAVTNLSYHNLQDMQNQAQQLQNLSTEEENLPATEQTMPTETLPTDTTLTDNENTGAEPATGSDSNATLETRSAPDIDMSEQVFTLGNMGIDMGNILIASVAVVFIAAEYATRSINTTMTAVPKRSMLFFAKMLVVSIYSFIMGFVVSAAGFLISYPLLDAGLRESYPIEPGIFLNCLVVGLYFMMLSWMGLGFGALMRNNAGGIMLVVLCLFILPIILAIFTAFGWVEDAISYLPNALGREMLAYRVADDAKFNNLQAAGLLSIWCVVPALLGYLRIRLTDPK